MPALMAKPMTAAPMTSLRSCIRELLSILDGRRVAPSGPDVVGSWLCALSGSTEEAARELAAARAVRGVAAGAGAGSAQVPEVISAEGGDDPSAVCRSGWFDGLVGEDGEGAGATTGD